MSGSFYRGTTAEQDGRFSNKEKRMIRNQQWPESYNTRVDIKKVNLQLLRAWIERKLDEIAGVEDEVVTNYVISELETSTDKGPDPKILEINLEDTKPRPFVTELWDMLIASQNSPEGIADSVVVEQKGEIDLKKLEIENEVQRVRDMMLKIQGRTDSNHNNIPSMPEISGKSAASQSYFRPPENIRPESTPKQRRPEEKEERRAEKRDSSREKERHHRDRSRTKKRSKRRDNSSSQSRSAKSKHKVKKERKTSKKEKKQKPAEANDAEKEIKKDKKSKSKKKRKVSVSSSYEKRDSSSLSSD